MTICYDNFPHAGGLKTGWGFSCFVEGGDEKILFDTGANGSKLLTNLEVLGIDPAQIKTIFLSHNHYDHVGGLASLLEHSDFPKVILLSSFSEKQKQEIARNAEVLEVSQPQPIMPGIFTTGELGRTIKEQSLVVNLTGGLVIVTGCAHPGIVEITRFAMEMLKNDILLVLGGFHLGGVALREMRRVAMAMKEIGVRYVGASHCTGRRAREVFEEEFGDHFIRIGVGKVIRTEELRD